MTGGASYNTFRHTASTAAVLEYQKYGLGIVQEYLKSRVGGEIGGEAWDACGGES